MRTNETELPRHGQPLAKWCVWGEGGGGGPPGSSPGASCPATASGAMCPVDASMGCVQSSLRLTASTAASTRRAQTGAQPPHPAALSPAAASRVPLCVTQPPDCSIPHAAKRAGLRTVRSPARSAGSAPVAGAAGKRPRVSPRPSRRSSSRPSSSCGIPSRGGIRPWRGPTACPWPSSCGCRLPTPRSPLPGRRRRRHPARSFR